ncbi:hypothetical protein MKW92_039826, partial [Papaver armeniacum]
MIECHSYAKTTHIFELLIKALVLTPEALRLDVSASDAAMTLGIAPALAKEHLLTAETK